MSKFVTYPAVTMLDNDHSLLIDDPNAGTNSITAENAGNTLLSKWAGFETFDEAVQNTISNNQKFIDRDTAIREETAELKKKIVTTFPAKEASGAVATFESEFEDAPLKSCIVRVNPVQDLHGYDHPWPAGGGKNKLLFKTEDLTASKYGMELSYNATTEVITVTGTETHGSAFSIATTYQYRLPNFVAGETYTISRAQVTGNLDENIYFQITYRRLNGQSTALVLNRTASTTFTVPNDFDDVTNIFVGVFAGVSNVNNAFKLQLESGSTATDWTPYNENICPITGWTGCEVQRTGENLFPYKDVESQTKNGITFTVEKSNGVITNIHMQGTATAQFSFPFYVNGVDEPWVLPEGDFLLYIGGDKPTQIRRFDLNIRKLGTTSDIIATFGTTRITLSEQTTFASAYIWIYSGAVLNHNIIPVIVRSGVDTSVKYPLTQRQTYPITFPTEAGTVYGGYIDPINGEIVADRAMVDLGTKNWGKRSLTDRSVFYCYLVSENPRVYSSISENMTELCSNYPFGAKHNGPSNLAAAVPNKSWGRTFDMSTFFVIRDDDYDDAASFKEAMSGVQLCYELAEPIYYPITAIDIKTLLGQNNIWADTGDVSVKYLMSDVSWYVEKKLRAFQSILAGVEDSSTASKNYSANTYLIFNDDIYKTTKAITAGETIEEGVNVTKTTVAEQLLALAQA